MAPFLVMVVIFFMYYIWKAIYNETKEDTGPFHHGGPYWRGMLFQVEDSYGGQWRDNKPALVSILFAGVPVGF